ncbi:MAG: hypothetical protein A2Y38_23590 [Spirochaetes bacterium GWB1_59_5]|nr:MAG: hypothetical protein A2Y38_23590 [Spirochaetes bacterium GWB1_59_5]
MGQTVLVIGSLGTVGLEVVRSLIAGGTRVRAATTRRDAVRSIFGDTVEPVLFDFQKPETFGPAFDGVERMFLMRPPHISNIKRDLYPALDAARAAGVRQVVFLSIIGIDQNTVVPHYKVETYLRGSGQDYTFLRCSFFMQNFEAAHRDEIRDRDEIYLPVGKAKTSFIDARDIGAVAALCLSGPGHERKAYDLTGAEALDYDEVAALFSAVLNRPIVYRNPAPLAFFLRQLSLRKALMYALVTTWLYSNTKNGMAATVSGEVARLLGRLPISMLKYIEDNRAAWMS